MSQAPMRDGIRALERMLGDERRTLALGEWRVRLEGLDRVLAGALERRWGSYLGSGNRADLVLRAFHSPAGGWLDPPRPGEPYRLEALGDAASRTIASYNFALCADAEPFTWRVAVHRRDEEPLDRLFENAVRYLAAHLGVEKGGFAMHAAGVLHDGRAWIFAGPSRSGKSTAVALAAPAVSLGDDFALVHPGERGWRAAALPFDNSERARPDAPHGSFPLAGIWRLHKSDVTRVARLPQSAALASLMSCAAFPWAMPEFSEELLDHLHRYVDGAYFAELHFRKHGSVWPVLLDERPRGRGRE